MKRLLLCSIACPPKNDPESLQVGKYIQGILSTKEFSVDVLTSSSPTLFMPEDKSLNKYLDGVDNIYTKSIKENKYLNFIKRKIGASNIFRPDSKYSFYKSDDFKLYESMDKPDVICSRSFPMSSTLEAFKLQSYYNVPWVLHLSDPWSCSPIHSIRKKDKVWTLEWERKCFEKAALISLTSLQTIELYRKQYPEFSEKFIYCPNVLEKKSSRNSDFSKEQHIHLVYTGGLAGSRTLEPLFDALSNLSTENMQKIKLSIAGPMDRKNKTILNRYLNLDIDYKGVVSYEESKELLSGADVLIVVDNDVNNDTDAVFFPSKVLDYFTAQKVILAITTPNSCTESVLSKSDFVVYRDHLSQIEEALKEILSLERYQFYVNRDDELMFYNNHYQGEILVDLIKELL